MSKLKLSTATSDGEYRVRIQGIMDADAKALALNLSQWPAEVRMDLEELESMDIQGVLVWRQWMKQILSAGKQIFFRNISRPLVEKMHLYRDCLPKKYVVESFQLALICEDCQLTFNKFLALGQDYFSRRPVPDIELSPCPKCGRPCRELVEFGSYFNFLPEFELNAVELYDNLQVGTLIVDENKAIVFGNEFAANLLKTSVKRLLKREIRIDELIDFKSEKLQFIKERPTHEWSERQIQESEFSLKGGGGGVVQIYMRKDVRSTEFRKSWHLFLHDVSLEISLNEKYNLESKGKQEFETLASIDKMTGIYNFRSFTIRFRNELQEAAQKLSAIGLIIMDIDHFKKFNDNYGHLQGDEVLKVVAQALKANVREDDFVARYGGEEFVILIRKATKEILAACAEKIRLKVSEAAINHINNPGQLLQVTASFGGISIHGRHLQGVQWDKLTEQELKEFVGKADKNLYQAKEQGRNCCVVSEWSGT